ncbi:MAG: hypothetical protein M5F18_00865 [Asgard group archaeon]|nr:hypothetical protein [Asgard group archaeon]
MATIVINNSDNPIDINTVVRDIKRNQVAGKVVNLLQYLRGTKLNYKTVESRL